MSRLNVLLFFHIDISSKLKAFLRRSEFIMITLAAITGACAGLVVAGMSTLSRYLHSMIFQIPASDRLSSAYGIEPVLILAGPIAGGIVMGAILLLLRFIGKKPMVDPMEANALHGGRMSLTDSLIVGGQNTISNGFGASVGLEAGFTQISSSIASRLGQMLSLRRNDLRILVGCGSAGAIAAAFHAPLTGAFYAFELIIGTYTIFALAPVVISAIVATTVSSLLTGSVFTIAVGSFGATETADFLPAIVLGAVAALAGILLMLGVSFVEELARKSTVPVWIRPALGGIIVGLLALRSPQVLSAGHGAMHLDLPSGIGVSALISVIVMKSLASAVSIGSGFRGGLFFASLFLGALIGKLFAAAAVVLFQDANLTPLVYAVIGMSSFAASVIGGPLTMTFLALEITGNLSITALVLAACITASLIVRNLFGYSFSTWRFHLRGENLRSPQDVGWIRNLTVDTMMRTDVRTIEQATTVADFKLKYPLGSAQRVIVVNADSRYVGMIIVADIYSSLVSQDDRNRTIEPYISLRDQYLVGTQNAREAATRFENNECEALAVVNNRDEKIVTGLLTEAYTLRRLAQETEAHRREVFGEY